MTSIISLWGSNILSLEVIKTIIDVPLYRLLILSWKFLEYRIYVRDQSSSTLIIHQQYWISCALSPRYRYRYQARTNKGGYQLTPYCVISCILRSDTRGGGGGRGLSIETAINQANHPRTNLRPTHELIAFHETTII